MHIKSQLSYKNFQIKYLLECFSMFRVHITHSQGMYIKQTNTSLTETKYIVNLTITYILLII